jgi:transcriptional regulator with XRE-family HTH domain
MLVVQPEELRAWRLRLGLTQEEVAARAKSLKIPLTQKRLSDAEIRLLGTVTTYLGINRALASFDAERKAIAA